MTERDRRRFCREWEAELLRLGFDQAQAKAEAARAWARTERRLEWLKAQFDEMLRLHDALGDYWSAYFDARPEIDPGNADRPALPEPPEQEALERVEAAIEAARLRDEWPRHLHFAGL